MLCSFTTRFRNFIWFLIFTFTLYCIPNYELLLPYKINFGIPEAGAAEGTQAPEIQTGKNQIPEAQTKGVKEKTAEETSAASSTSVSSLSGGDGGSGGGGLGMNASVPENLMFTGAATYKIPIEVPPGRAGIAPSLSLSYDSYQSSGWVGVGWSLDMGSIQRSTKRGVNYSANDYVALINGSCSELLPRSDWGTNYYGNKVEGALLKYYFKSSTEGWEVTAKDGTKYY